MQPLASPHRDGESNLVLNKHDQTALSRIKGVYVGIRVTYVFRPIFRFSGFSAMAL